MLWTLGGYRFIGMFLNLKSKRVETALQQHLKTHNHPKTQRDQRPERTSKEHNQRLTKKPTPNMMIKKQTASTALTTMQTGSSYSNVAHHYVIQRIDSTEKQTESIGKSIEKLDSHRSQRIANAYRKIKKNETIERTVTEQPLEEPPRKSHNRTHYPLNKKEIVSAFANNYIAITEADELDSRRDKYAERQATSYFSKLIELLLQVFRNGKPKVSVVKFRSLSSKEIDLNDSLEKSKRSNKNLKNKSRQQGKEHVHPEESETFQDLIERFRENIMKSEQRSEGLGGEQWVQVNMLVKELYAEMGQFMRDLHGRCQIELEEQLKQYEKGLEIVLMEQQELESHCKHLEEALAIQRNRTSILAQSLEEMHNKTLYCSAFFNQLSYNFDLDSFLREKICEFAGQNPSIINSHLHSNSSLALKQEFLDAQFGFHKERRKG